MDKLILVGCEESQAVTAAFRARGDLAYSCDILPTRGNPDWHFECDVMKVLDALPWDLIILHPDCTALAVSGNRWYGDGMPRNNERIAAIHWTGELWRRACEACDRVVLENPVSVIFQYLDAPVQYVQPWQFGHGETKKTGLALHGLPPLNSTDLVDGREQRVWKMAPGQHRKRDRATTYKGIAAAMANQWGDALQT